MHYKYAQWVPGAYIMQGLPYALVSLISPVLYKNFNFNNSEIAFYTSLFTLPWILKFLIAPALERFKKRSIIITIQIIVMILLLSLAFSFYFTYWYYLTGFIFILIAILGTIYDINIDGLYLEALDLHHQAKFTGLRTVFYQLGRLICQGGLLFVVGLLSIRMNKSMTWSVAFIMLAIFVSSITFIQQKKLPSTQPTISTHYSYSIIFKNFFHLSHITAIIVFLLFFEMPEAQLTKIVPLYMMEPISLGGLGLTIENIGVMYGGIGLISMLLGITLSGILLTRFSLKKCLIPFSILATLAYTSYIFLNYYPHHIPIIVCIMLSGFGFGLNNGAYMLYLVRFFSNKPHAMSMYAIGSSLMLFGMMAWGSMSGYIEEYLGYSGFFIWIALLSFGTIFLAVYNVKRIL